ncbi:tripeptide aminopeptidase PepT [Elioraea tepida]|uniref:Tripeptide aminopeptidase PepT n=1 Tax=Elioraea tepida TaxID=2843330 RepID=A0A975U1S6_9PROT|nr:tripeptide aminopeptidase PepT [Elioraea tepida]QXM24342.1 tripeptide aminopeptidase PepT [Elioraea tepida]
MVDVIAELGDRLVRYCRIDTQSDPDSKTTPSTEKQYELLRLLERELTEMGAADVTLLPYGTLVATIPTTVETNAPTIAFCAHVDTTPQFIGRGVKPIIHRAWDGSDIVLPDNPTQVLSARELPYLASRIGHDIVTASGTTLLGADDKTGVAILMTMARHLLANPSLPHGTIRLCFTPDEEIGRGVHPELPKALGAAFAYTLDGGERGELVCETFSADLAKIEIEGVSIHPGWAKGKLVNALHLMARIIDILPQATDTPEVSDGRRGFWHVVSAGGSAARSRPAPTRTPARIPAWRGARARGSGGPPEDRPTIAAGPTAAGPWRAANTTASCPAC